MLHECELNSSRRRTKLVHHEDSKHATISCALLGIRHIWSYANSGMFDGKWTSATSSGGSISFMGEMIKTGSPILGE